MLIEQSIAKQYGVLPSQQEHLSYADWAKMVGGLMNDTPLGQIVGIRNEKDRDIIRNMSPLQRQIRSEWATFQASRLSKESTEDMKTQMNRLETMIAGLFGGR